MRHRDETKSSALRDQWSIARDLLPPRPDPEQDRLISRVKVPLVRVGQGTPADLTATLEIPKPDRVLTLLSR